MIILKHVSHYLDSMTNQIHKQTLHTSLPSSKSSVHSCVHSCIHSFIYLFISTWWSMMGHEWMLCSVETNSSNRFCVLVLCAFFFSFGFYMSQQNLWFRNIFLWIFFHFFSRIHPIIHPCVFDTCHQFILCNSECFHFDAHACVAVFWCVPRFICSPAHTCREIDWSRRSGRTSAEPTLYGWPPCVRFSIRDVLFHVLHSSVIPYIHPLFGRNIMLLIACFHISARI